MLMFQLIKIQPYERGLLFRHGVFVRLLLPGWQMVPGRLLRAKVERVSVRDIFLKHADLDVIVRSGALEADAAVLELGSHERAVVWVNDRVETVLGPGLRVVWTAFNEVRIERFDARSVRLEHGDLASMLAAAGAHEQLQPVEVPAGSSALVFREGRLHEQLVPGLYAYWRGEGRVVVSVVDQREQTVDVSGQELMTSDRVTLRLNATVTYRIVDPEKAYLQVENVEQALYRQAQLALREVVGSRSLDGLLAEKSEVAGELRTELARVAETFGLEVRSLGIRDVILPGEMKEILNRVVEARKGAEADLITRQQETAAMRSQANTARIFEKNPTLMRLRELEVLETVAEKADLKVVLGESGLKDRMIQLV